MLVFSLPCGRSAHLEAGQAIGAGKPTIIYMPQAEEPELMYKMAYAVCSTLVDVRMRLLSSLPRPMGEVHFGEETND